MAEGYGTEPMFQIPAKYRPPKRKQKWPTWGTYHGKLMSCDDCIMAIANGTRLFTSEYATNVRTDKDGRRYFCSRHTEQRKTADGL